MLVGLPTAQAADTTLTLACQGTVTTKVILGKFVDYEPSRSQWANKCISAICARSAWK
jgi:hypothetical protein